jgi:cytochrome c-type biogenesis protein CcmH/NrfF
LLGLGILMLFRTLRQRRRLREAEFSDTEEQRLKQLLGEAAGDREDRA